MHEKSPSVELVEQALAALNAGKIDELVALCDRDFELDMSDRVFNPSTYRGHDGIRQFHTEVLEVWDHYTWVPEQVVCHGDVVVALLRTSGKGRGSGLEVERQTAMIWTMRGDKASSLRFYRDQDRALAAADSRDRRSTGYYRARVSCYVARGAEVPLCRKAIHPLYEGPARRLPLAR